MRPRTLSISALAVLLTACGGSQLANSKGSFAPQSQAHAGAASPAYAVLYRFVNDVNGSAPTAELIDVNGALYGTTSKGGSGCKNAGCGTAYTMSTSGLEKVVYRFAGHPSDGSNPLAGLHDVSGTLYGTTIHGGKSGWGTVFSIGSNGAEKVMHSFTGGSDGALPTSGLIDVNGTLYGTTSFGGGYLGGTVFSISANGKLNVLHHFNYVPDARSPLAGLVNVKGALYGTTVQGGKYGLGAVFRISASGAETVVYSFSGGPDGSYPHARLIDANGTLYGTTYYGGSGCGGAGCGTVYSVTTDGHETVLYTFRGGSDGSYPVAGLVFLNGTLYGTTAWGGNSNCKGYGCGTVYSVSASGVEQVLHRFSGGRDGAAPEADLVAVNGTLYGTTSGAGRRRGHSVGPGTAFALRP